MNNFDRYDQAMRTDPLEAAALAAVWELAAKRAARG